MPLISFPALGRLLERQINPIFFGSIGIGLVIPWVDKVPAWTTIFLLALVTFMGCFKINPDDIKGLRPVTSIWFIAARYLLVPAAVFWLLKPMDFTIATAALLMILVPSGVVAPAMTGLFNGNVAFSLLVTIASHILFIFFAPIYLKTLLGQQVPLDATDMFLKLFGMVIVPALLYGLLRRKMPQIEQRLKPAATPLTVVLIALLIVIVIARLRYLLLQDFGFLAVGGAVVCALYAFNYLVAGWALGASQPPAIRRAMAVASGANNPVLAIVVATLYFSPRIQLLMLIGEVVWILAVPAFRWFLSHAVEEQEK